MRILLDFCDPRALGAAAAGTGALRCAFDDPLQTLVALTPEQVKPVLEAAQAQAQSGRWCVGFVRYEAASAFDSALCSHAGDSPLAWFGVFDKALPWPRPASGTENTQVEWHSTLQRSEFDANIARIHQAIGAGDLYQLNYTAPWHGNFCGAAPALFERLLRAQPNGYAAYIDTGAEQVLSVSPELFFDWQAGNILTRPMKGTAARTGNAQEDDALALALRHSAKERAENVMIVDLLRNDLSRIAEPFSVQVPQLFAVQRLPTVQQMVSDVTARTRAGTTLADVFGALFPCGSITGAPKVQAMRMIRALEPKPRGVYCGAIGVLRPGGHATFNVAIRSVTLKGTQATCGIGSGITFEASAAAEWQEWQHKRGFLERARAPFQLLETLRLEQGVLHNLVAHLARLAGAASHFGYAFDETRVRTALQQQAAQAAYSDDSWRVRLLLDETGQPEVEIFKLNSTPTPVQLALAATHFEANQSEFTRFKTTRRAHYEAFAPNHSSIFDTLLYNPKGELTECTRGNIALLLDGKWQTPALSCGLLAGVGRAQLMAQGRLQEAVITLTDLPRVQAFAFINSLRGWLPATLQGHTVSTAADL
jgi:para-aminobenzoate synthetase/4-amino-4-deoxychorismate lyase